MGEKLYVGSHAANHLSFKSPGVIVSRNEKPGDDGQAFQYDAAFKRGDTLGNPTGLFHCHRTRYSDREWPVGNRVLSGRASLGWQ